MDDNLINRYLKKYGLSVRVASRDFEREKMLKESLPFWSGRISKKKKRRRKRKREDRNHLPTKSRRRYSTNEKAVDRCLPHKYFSTSGTHKLNINKKKTNCSEHDKCSPCKLDEKKKNYFKMESPIVKILEEKKESERKKMMENTKCSREISQSKINNAMEELGKLSESPPEETGSGDGDVFARFSEQRLGNVTETFPLIHTCSNESDDSNKKEGVVANGGKQLKEVNKKCSQFKQKTVGKVSPTEKPTHGLCAFGGRYDLRISDSHLDSYVGKEALRTNNLCLDENELDSRGEDSEDDKQTVIFDERFGSLGKLKESSEKVSECKQQNVARNIKGKTLKNPRMLKRGKSSLVRIIMKEKMRLRKKLGKPTRKIGGQVSERGKETIMRGNKFVEKFEDNLAEVSNLVKHLHDTHNIIVRLKKDMEENEKLAEHFKTVIEAQQENYRKEIWRNQETIMKGYDKMMGFCKKSSTVSLEISRRTFLNVEDVENVLSRCILVENALEMLKSTQKLPALEKDEGKRGTEDREMKSCWEKERSVGTVATSGNKTEIIVKEPHGQIISLDECQDQLVCPEKSLRLSNNLNPEDGSTSSAKHLVFSCSATSVPCSISTHVLKERQVTPRKRGTCEHSKDLVLHQSQNHETNRHQIPYQSSQKSEVNFINQYHGRDHHQNSFAMAGFPPAGRIPDFIQHDKPRVEHIQTEKNIQNPVLIGEMRHCLHQPHLTKNLFQFSTSDSVQQILTTKRPPRPQNPIPRVFQPEVEMNSNRDKQQCLQQPGLMHRPSVQRRINVESNFAVPFNSITTGSLNQSKSSYLPHLMKSNPSTFGHHTSVRGIFRSLSSRNNITSASHPMLTQEVIPSHLSQSNTTISNTSNTSSMYTPTPVRTRTPTMPILLRPLQTPSFFSQNTNRCRVTVEAEPDLRASNPMQNIPSSMRAVHPVTQPSGSLSLMVTEQSLYASQGNVRALQTLREDKSSVPSCSYIVPTSSTAQKSKNDPPFLDPTIPQKLTMKNHRLQAGVILKSSAVVNKSKSQPDEDQVNRVIKVESIDLEEQEKVPETQTVDRRNSSRQYECAQNGCKNSGIRLCKGCESVIYCSGTCQLNHWKQKHKEECAKLRELHG